MAIGYDQRARNFNEVVNMFLRSLQSSKLMQQQMMGYAGLDAMRGRRNIELENLRHSDAMAEMKQNWINQVSRDPVVQQLQAQIFTDAQAGKDVAPMLDDLKQRIFDVSKAAANLTTGDKVLPSDFETVLDNLSEDAVRTFAQQAGTNYREKRQIEEIGKPTLRLRGEELEVDKAKLGLESEKFAKEGKDETRDLWLDTVKYAEDWLKSEGVKVEDPNQIKQSFASSGRVPDPLSPEHRGQALVWLGELRTKLIEGRSLTEPDKRFLERVRSSNYFRPKEEAPKVEPKVKEKAKGNFPSKDTGLFDSEIYAKCEQAIRAGIARRSREGRALPTEEKIRESINRLFEQVTGRRYEEK